MSLKKLTLFLAIGIFAYTGTAQAYPYHGGGGTTLSPKTYAILIGSQASSGGIENAIRGDLDVDHVASQLSWASDVIVLKYNWDNIESNVAGDIQLAASTIAGKVKPGDSFIFYYSGHGTGGAGEGVQDFINPVKGDGYQDNSLASVFSDSVFGSVKKYFLIDSCHAEGMWKNDSADDQDLQTLRNISFLGSSPEAGVAFADSDKNGTGLFTNALLPALTPDATFGNLLLTAMATSGTQVTGFFKDDGLGMGIMQPVGFTSSDFDPNSTISGQPVPEPASLALILASAAVALVWRRRRG
jgi:hypothetical protein